MKKLKKLYITDENKIKTGYNRIKPNQKRIKQTDIKRIQQYKNQIKTGYTPDYIRKKQVKTG